MVHVSVRGREQVKRVTTAAQLAGGGFGATFADSPRDLHDRRVRSSHPEGHTPFLSSSLKEEALSSVLKAIHFAQTENLVRVFINEGEQVEKLVKETRYSIG